MSELMSVDNKAIKNMIKTGDFKEMQVAKTKPVTSQVVPEGGLVSFETTVKKDGELVCETVNKNIAPGDIVVTNQIEGYTNSWVIKPEKFTQKYHPADENDLHYPKDMGLNKTVYLMSESTELTFEAPWGSEITVYGNGAIVPEDPNDFDQGFYGINDEELRATHELVAGGEIPKYEEI